MKKELLFTRKFKGETYNFYLNKGIGCLGIHAEYINVETPENDFGYSDTILFNGGSPYTLNRYCPQWILKACTNVIIKKGYSQYIQ